MPPRRDERVLYQCVEPFAVFRDGIPEVYGADRMVLAGDPILKTHAHHFRLAADRVEAMTASPGERRPVAIPTPPEVQPVVITEPEEAPHA